MQKDEHVIKQKYVNYKRNDECNIHLQKKKDPCTQDPCTTAINDVLKEYTALKEVLLH